MTALLIKNQNQNVDQLAQKINRTVKWIFIALAITSLFATIGAWIDHKAAPLYFGAFTLVEFAAMAFLLQHATSPKKFVWQEWIAIAIMFAGLYFMVKSGGL